MEAIPSSKPDPIGTPDGLFIRPKIMAIFDLVKDTMTIVTPVRPVPDKSAEQAWESAENRLSKSVKKFGRPLNRRISKAPGKTTFFETSLKHFQRTFHQNGSKGKRLYSGRRYLSGCSVPKV